MLRRYQSTGASIALLMATAAGCSSSDTHGRAEEASRASAQALSAPGSEQCDALTASSFDPILALLDNAKASAAANMQAHPDGDAQTLVNSIAQATLEISSQAAWVASVGYDGTNPSVASNVLAGLNGTLPRVLDAMSAASRSAGRQRSYEAKTTFETLTLAAIAMNELATTGGRCDLDKYSNGADSWDDWRKGEQPETMAPAPPAIPSGCKDIGAGTLDPLVSLLASAADYERSEIAAHPGDGSTEYAQSDLDSATAQTKSIQTLRDSLAASSNNAGDVATATSIQTLVSSSAASMVLGAQEATYTNALLPGPSRNAFEANMTAGEYAIQLAAAAGRCTYAPAFLRQVEDPFRGPPIPPTNYIIQIDSVDVIEANDEVWSGQTDPFVEYAALAVNVTHADASFVTSPQVAGCTLGDAKAGTRLSACSDSGTSHFSKGQRLSQIIQVSDPRDIAHVAVSLNNIHGIDVQAANAATSSTLNSLGSSAAIGGAIIGVASAGLGAVVSVIGTWMTLAGSFSSSRVDDPNWCAGGLIQTPDPAASSTKRCPSFVSNCDLHDDVIVPNSPLDTIYIDLTPERLWSLTASGPAVVTYNPSITWPNQLGPFDLLSVYEKGACNSKHAIHVSIARDWRTGLAPSPKSGDAAFKRTADEIDDITAPIVSVPIFQRRAWNQSWAKAETINPSVDLTPTLIDPTDLSQIPIASISRAEDKFDVFWVDEQGVLRTAFWTEAAGYTQLAIRNGLPPHAHLSVASRKPGNLDLFWVGNDGAVETTFWSDVTDWTTTLVADPGSAAPGSGVAAIARNPDQLDVFYVKPDGAIYTGFWHDGGGWGTKPVSQPGLADVSSNSNITATARSTTDLDVFFIGANGSIYQSTWFDGAPNWATNVLNLGVTASAQEPNISSVSGHADSLAIAFTAQGNLYVSTWSDGAAAWTTTAVAEHTEGNAFSGVFPISIVARDRYDLDVFFKDAWLNPWKAHWSYGSNWSASAF